MNAGANSLRIVFDFGGVLFNWQPRELVQRFLPQHATDDASIRALIASVFQGFTGDWAQFDRGIVAADELVQRIAARTGFDADDVAALVEGVPPSLTPKHDTVQMLRRLRAAGMPLHFLSNMPLPYAEHLDRSHPELMSHFESGLYSAHVQLIKPEPALYELASRRFGVPADRLVLLDDVAANVEAARASGWNALQFSDAQSSEQALRDHGWWPAV